MSSYRKDDVVEKGKGGGNKTMEKEGGEKD